LLEDCLKRDKQKHVNKQFKQEEEKRHKAKVKKYSLFFIYEKLRKISA